MRPESLQKSVNIYVLWFSFSRMRSYISQKKSTSSYTTCHAIVFEFGMFFFLILHINNDEAEAALRTTQMLFCCTKAPSTGKKCALHQQKKTKHFPSTLDEKYHLISPVRDSWSLFRQSSETERQKYTWDRSPISHQTHSTGINHPVNRFKYCKRLYEKRRQDKRFYFESEDTSAQTSVVNLNHCWGNRNSLYYHLLPRAARMVSSGDGTSWSWAEFQMPVCWKQQVDYSLPEGNERSEQHTQIRFSQMISDSTKCTYMKSVGANIQQLAIPVSQRTAPLCWAISLSCELSQRLSVSQRLHCLQRSVELLSPTPVLEFLQLGATAGSSSSRQRAESILIWRARDNSCIWPETGSRNICTLMRQTHSRLAWRHLGQG